MRNVKPYPEYKDSGVEWLGEVPAHWEVRRAKTLLRPIDVRSRDGSEELLTVSSNLGVIPRSSASVTMFKAESYVGYKLCWPGDLVINSLWAWARGLGVTKYHGIISSAYGVYRRLAHAELNVGFLDKLVRSEPFHWELRVRSKGIWISRLQLTDESFLGAPLPLPPLPEQTAIVRFLDYVDRRVRRVIRSRRRLVKLLEEYKQALIHQAVTGRIDVRTGQPYPEYKDSGVEWLGQVPAHWEVNHLSRCLARIDQGWSPRAAEGDLADNQWAVLTLSAVRKGVFDAKAVKPIPLGTPIREGIQVADGDLLMTRSNTRELVGDVCIVRGVRPKTVLCDLVYRLVVHSDLLDAEFLMLLLLSRIGRSQIEREARGSSGTMPKVSQQRIRALVVLLPPLTEQTSIVEYLDEQTGKVDRAIEAAQREIELLQEFRTRLIADVVTGKLDVREVVARLPEEPEEPEPLDELEENTELEEAADDLDEASEEAVA
jgi:type I restriction enzyme S subunit